MSETEPLISATPEVDPYELHMLVRSLTPEIDYERLGARGTSISVITTGDPGRLLEQFEADSTTRIRSLRSEILALCDPETARLHGRGTDRSNRKVRVKAVGVPQGGRLESLAESIANASNEFIVVEGRDLSPLNGLSQVLGHLWVEGADLAVVSAAGADPDPIGRDEDVAAAVARWLGVTTDSDADVTVIMRRWFARWIFNEIERSLDPVVEIADRVRLLGTTVIYAETGELLLRADESAGHAAEQ